MMFCLPKGLKLCMVQFWVAILEILHNKEGKSFNIEIEKSEQTLFVQISLSQNKDSFTACATKLFKHHNKNTGQRRTFSP